MHTHSNLIPIIIIFSNLFFEHLHQTILFWALKSTWTHIDMIRNSHTWARPDRKRTRITKSLKFNWKTNQKSLFVWNHHAMLKLLLNLTMQPNQPLNIQHLPFFVLSHSNGNETRVQLNRFNIV